MCVCECEVIGDTCEINPADKARGDYNYFTNVVFQRNMDLHISN